MLIQHIALVPEAGGVSASELARVSAALQKQVARDLGPVWGIAGTVDPFPDLEEVPVGYWPIILSVDAVGHESGVQRDDNGHPYAHIALTPDWSLQASRACLEMLVNPYGERTISAPSLRSEQGLVEFLIEVCAPCQDVRHSYAIHDVAVADFCTPLFFASTWASAQRHGFTFRGSIQRPFQLRRGGHLTWHDAISDSWWMRNHWHDNPIDVQLGAIDKRFGSPRELASFWRPARVHPPSVTREVVEAFAGVERHRVIQAAQHRAFRLRALLSQRSEGLERPTTDPFSEPFSDIAYRGKEPLSGSRPLTLVGDDIIEDWSEVDEPFEPTVLREVQVTTLPPRLEAPPSQQRLETRVASSERRHATHDGPQTARERAHAAPVNSPAVAATSEPAARVTTPESLRPVSVLAPARTEKAWSSREVTLLLASIAALALGVVWLGRGAPLASNLTRAYASQAPAAPPVTKGRAPDLVAPASAKPVSAPQGQALPQGTEADLAQPTASRHLEAAHDSKPSSSVSLHPSTSTEAPATASEERQARRARRARLEGTKTPVAPEAAVPKTSVAPALRSSAPEPSASIVDLFNTRE